MRSGWLAAALFLATQQSLVGQSELAMPAWLAAYPGVTALTETFKSLLESTYATSARPTAVTEHYRKLFEAQSLSFVPNFDGMGTVVRAVAPECDLMITIREQDSKTLVRVDCAAKAPAPKTWTAVPDSTSKTAARTGARPLSPKSQADFQARVAEADERHKQIVKDLNIHPTYQDAPAPPLVWPAWLVHVRGSKLTTRAGVDPAGHEYLKSRYVSSAPMTEIYAFYEDSLKANSYPVHSSELSTGQTISGIVQNAYGHVEGINYPNGHPGPYTEIKVSFSRFRLNEPITVDLTFTTYAFKAPPPFGR
jgi:hypothetical protein